MSKDWPLEAVNSTKDTSEGLTSSEVSKVEEAVHELLGPDQKIVGVEKKVIVREEEVIMVNGTPIALEGQEGEAIKECLLRGAIPNQDLLNHLLYKAGLIVAPNTSKPVKTEMNLTTALTTRESAFLHQNGTVLDHRVHQAKDVSRSSTSRQDDIWHPAPLATVEPMDEIDFVPVSQATVTNKSSKAILTSVPNIKAGLVYSDSEPDLIDSGSLDELIHEFVPRAHFVPSEDYQFSFLLASRLFLTPNRLLAEVYRRADQIGHMLSHAESHPTFATNVVQMLSHWMVWFPSDFRDESMLNRARQFVRLTVEWHPPSETKLNQLMQSLTTQLNAIERHEKQLEKLKSNNKHTSCQIQDLLETEYSAMVFAQELTRIELEHLCFLGPEELVHAFAKESSQGSSQSLPTDEFESESQEARQRAARRTKNLQAYVDWFNRLSYLVATLVCQKKKKKNRVKVIEFWIEVARECVNGGNFNSLMGIITGLNMIPVARLKRTWQKIQSAGKFAVLEHQMNPSSNFLSYRATLKAAISRSEGATDQRQRIVIPFFSLLVKDLLVVNEATASRLSNGHINFAKARNLAQKLKEFAIWKDVESPYAKTPVVAEFLQNSPIWSEKVLDLESFECEAPELHEEKERCKKLKHQMKEEVSH